MSRTRNAMIRVFLIGGIMFISFSCANTINPDIPDNIIRSLHDKILTLDSHTDTPLNFTYDDFNFAERHNPHDGGTKIDLPRMKDGGLDGIFFAVFLGQSERTEEGYLTAKNKAHQLFDSIFSTLNRNNEYLELAVDSRSFRKTVRRGKHAIFIGLENGYPIGKEISLVDSFYNLGARYITLCHTQNNDICDSSTDPNGPEHGGLSDFGKNVVRRMNEIGMMIDVSHISDEAFYDVIEISSKPIIASHSCARALCDNPRNLNDNMLRTLAANGGVIQMCILSDYVETPLHSKQRDSARNAVTDKHGNYYTLDDAGKKAFLKDWYAVDRDFPPGISTVSKVADHIDHIVGIAGIDHIGIGTDFDGGGGVEGCFDVSEIGNITAELVRRGYTEREIAKIWSGNLLRVMNRQLN